jgi:hypothetical protein
MWNVHSASRLLVAGPQGVVVVDRLVATRGTQTVIDADTWSKAAKYGKAGKAIPFVGGAISVGSAGWDQWRDDASNPNLTTTDRVGRSVGVGTYVGGAAIAGATVGSIVPVGGTAVGLVVGAGVGLTVGAVATSITPVKNAAADAGQWTANAAVDSYNFVEGGVSDAAGWADDRIDDIGDAIPDLNPF